MQETSGLPFASIHEGVMQRAGTMVIPLCFWESLKLSRREYQGNVRFTSNPLKRLCGRSLMVEDGAVEGVDEIYGAHLWNYQSFEPLVSTRRSWLHPTNSRSA